jgi:hypothetical protein
MTSKTVYSSILASLVSIVLLSYGLSTWVPFTNTLSLLGSILIIAGCVVYAKYTGVLSKKEEKPSSDMDDIANMISEMDEVISEYENMLSEQLVKLPCNCGQTLFEGILIPNAENMCKCPSCKETYKVMVSYDSILVTEPLEPATIYENLTKAASTDINKTLE